MKTWMLLIVFGALALMYVFLIIRQRRQAKRSEEIINSFRVGDKVITHIGIYGKIKRIYNTTFGKVCVLEIGTLNKVDIEMDMRYISALDEKVVVADEEKEEIKEEDKKEKEQIKETLIEENNNSEQKQEKTQKSKNKKTTKKK